MDSDAKETPGHKTLRMDKFQYSVATLKLPRKKLLGDGGSVRGFRHPLGVLEHIPGDQGLGLLYYYFFACFQQR